MLNYLVRRVFTSILVLLGVSMLVFLVIHLVPGDVTVAILGRRATAEKVAELREQLGLNDPIYVQYGHYLNNALHGDLGTSIRNNLPVAKSIGNQLPSTIALSIAAHAFFNRSTADHTDSAVTSVATVSEKEVNNNRPSSGRTPSTSSTSAA